MARLDLFLGCVVPAMLHGCELWVLSPRQAKALDFWFFSRLRQVLRVDYTTRLVAQVADPVGASFAECANMAEAALGRQVLPASSLWRARRLGMFGRLVRRLAVSQEAGAQPPLHVLAAFQWEIHAGEEAAVVPTAAEAERFLVAGRQGSWRSQVMVDMATAVPVLGLADTRSRAGWAAGARSIPPSSDHVARTGPATGPPGPRVGARRQRGPPLQLWETAGVGSARDAAAAEAADPAAQAARAAQAVQVTPWLSRRDPTKRCTLCSRLGCRLNDPLCVKGYRCSRCAKKGRLPAVVASHATWYCTTSYERLCAGCSIHGPEDRCGSGHQYEECPVLLRRQQLEVLRAAGADV